MITWRKFKYHKLDKIVERLGGLNKGYRESPVFLVNCHFKNDTSAKSYVCLARLVKHEDYEVTAMGSRYSLLVFSLSGNIVATHYSIINKPKNKKKQVIYETSRFQGK